MKTALYAYTFLILAAAALAGPAATLTITNTIGAVAAGGTMTVVFSVQNTGTTTEIFQIGAQIQQGSMVVIQIGQASTASLVPNAAGTATITFTLPSDCSTGAYTAYSVVWDGPPGNSDWLNSATQDFTVGTVVSATAAITNTIPTMGPAGTVPVQSSITNTGNVTTTFDAAAEIEQPSGSPIQLNNSRAYRFHELEELLAGREFEPLGPDPHAL